MLKHRLNSARHTAKRQPILYIDDKIRQFVGFFNINLIMPAKMDCTASPYTLLLLFFTGLAVAQYAPPPLEAPAYGSSTITGTLGSGQHNALLAAVRAAGLEELLGREGPFTIFAPSESAISEWAGSDLGDKLLPENRQELRAMLSYHIIAGRHTAAGILKALCSGAGTTTLTTVQGNEILASMEGIEIILTDCTGNSARITSADADRQNGVIHFIDRVIMPR